MAYYRQKMICHSFIVTLNCINLFKPDVRTQVVYVDFAAVDASPKCCCDFAAVDVGRKCVASNIICCVQSLRRVELLGRNYEMDYEDAASDDAQDV